MSFKSLGKKLWGFWKYIWQGDDVLSWVLSIVIAFILIKFVFYPVIGLLLATSHPIVAIVSGSMEHKITDTDTPMPTVCGQSYDFEQGLSLSEYWEYCGKWYDLRKISQDDFRDFSFKNGLNKGDVMVLRNPGAEHIDVGDVIVFIQEQNPGREPIIHRVVAVFNNDGEIYFQTKGDHNPDSINVSTQTKYLNEFRVTENQLVGKAILRIPFVGYVKLLAYDLYVGIRGMMS